MIGKLAWKLCLSHPLPETRGGGISCAMTLVFDMDDRARLPWRFFGASLTILASLL